MRRDSIKLMLLAGVVAFAVLYGMDLAGSGIQRVYGPLDNPGATAEDGSGYGPAADDASAVKPDAKSAENGSASGRSSRYYAREPEGIAFDNPDEPVIPRFGKEAVVDRIAGKTGEVLHDLSKEGIRMVAHLFDQAAN